MALLLLPEEDDSDGGTGEGVEEGEEPEDDRRRQTTETISSLQGAFSFGAIEFTFYDSDGSGYSLLLPNGKFHFSQLAQDLGG